MSTSICKLPNLIIAGVHKAGTTSLYTYLARHPNICASHTKEIGFFYPLAFGRPIRPIEEYTQHFAHCGTEPFRLEASPSYLYGKDRIATAIKSEIRDAKILVILRDPTDRLMSFFNRAVSKATISEHVTFAEYLTEAEAKQDSAEHTVFSRGIREGKYVEYIEPWQNAFGPDLRIMFFEDLKKSAHDFTRSVCDWLGLESGCYTRQDFTVENKTILHRRKRLHSFARNIYLRNETFWRKNHKLKQRLRGIYNALNTDRNSGLGIADEKAVARLREMYKPYNSQLKSFLQTHHYDEFPSWLA